MYFFLWMLCTSTLLYGQHYEIQYEAVNHIQLKAEKENDPIQQAIQKRYAVPQAYTLYTTGEECLYFKTPQLKPAHTGLQIRGNYTQDQVYSNFNEGFRVQQVALENKKYRIKEALAVEKWIYHRERQTILGLTVRKATLQKKNRLIELWFAQGIDTPCGPSTFYGLPGLVLEIKVHNQQNPGEYQHLYAIAIQKTDKKRVKQSTAGIEVTPLEFDKILTTYQDKLVEYYSTQGVEK